MRRVLPKFPAVGSAKGGSLLRFRISEHAQSPEAVELDLEWAKVLRRRGNGAAAVARLEHLILTYPQSALVPQARRELELAKGTIPPVVSKSKDQSPKTKES